MRETMRVIAVAIGALLCMPLGAEAECIGGPSATFKQVVGGNFSTCGLTAQGIAYCWGSDDGGRLGDGGAAGDSQSPVEVDATTITGEKAFIRLTAGDAHFCGLTSQGAAYCWGHDSHGQLGDGGGSDDAYSPVRVDTSGMPGPRAFVKLAGGGNHTCGLTGDGAAWCWGDDSSGQLGDGGVSSPSQVPVAVDRTPAGGRAFVHIAAGTNHTCALTAQGAIYCWGADDYGQLGDGAGASPSQSPALVDRSPAGDQAFVRLTAGFHHTCGLTAAGVAFCWGDASDGQLGDGGVVPSFVPSAVDTGPTGGRPFLELTAGSNHTCGLVAGGAAWCWGADNEGSLGNGGTSTPIHVPSPVDAAAVGDKPLVRLSAGGNHTCGLTAEYMPYCWGSDTYGQLGDGGTSAPAQSPVPVDAGQASGWTSIIQLTAGDEHNCAVTSNGEPICWGGDGLGGLGNGGIGLDVHMTSRVVTSPITGDKSFVHIDAGGFYSCGLTSQAVAYCWGYGSWGRLGDAGGEDDSQVPVLVDTSQVPGETTFGSINAGVAHTCGLTSAGVPYCWGYGGAGQMGNGSETQTNTRPVPVDTTPLAGGTFVQVKGGYWHTCGLTAGGAIYCWGDDANGQLGDGGAATRSTVPVAVDTNSITGEKSFIQMTVGYYHSCGITADGVAYCWGDDDYHQLGDGGVDADSQIPVAVDTSRITGEKSFVQIVSGWYHTCGLTSEGVAYCWGLGTYGELGRVGSTTVPFPVDTSTLPGEKTFVKLATGDDHTCGLTARGVVFCWGRDGEGQLGDGGTPADSAAPVPIEICLSCTGDADCGDGLGCTTETCDLTDGDEILVLSNDAFSITAQGGWTIDYANASANDPGTGADVIHSPDAATPIEILFTTQGSSEPYQVWIAHSRVKVQNGGGCDPTLTVDIDGAPFSNITEIADDAFTWDRFGYISLSPGPHTLQLACTGTCPTRRCAIDGLVLNTVGIDPRADPGFVPYLTAAWDDPALDRHDTRCAYTTASCDDGLFCNGQETCVQFLGCVPGSDPCFPLSCDEANDVCGGCVLDVDCPPCKFCDVGGVCANQPQGQDLKGDCTGECHTGVCNGLGACEARPVGTPCTGDGVYCNGPEECDAAGQCTGSGDPCPNTDCNHCNETADSCHDPAGAPCQDDGQFCNGAEACDGFGVCRSAGDPCPGTECNHCDEATDLCFDQAGTVCTDDGLFCTGDEICDGSGACTGTGDPCMAPLTCDEGADACTGCTTDADCAPCQWCNVDTCENQPAGQDLKGDCAPVDCMTGDCDGSGGCGTLPGGSPCTDDGLFCNGTEECDAFGFCISTGNPCPGTTCNNCQENQDNCLDPPGTPCTTDGLYCTGEEQCDGAGNCLSPGNPCPETECNHCQENLDSCFEPRGTPCTDDGLFCTGPEECDGQGACAGTGDPCPGGQCNTCQEDSDGCFDPAGTPCQDDGLFCTGVEECDGRGACAGTGDPCSDEECNRCNEDDHTCFDPPDTPCGECRLCDGAGLCDENLIASDWSACTDQDNCAGLCLDGFCAVEEVCNDADYCHEMTYPENEGHCRIPGDQVSAKIEMEPASGNAGEFVPARIVLSNRWDRALLRMSVTLRLNPPNADGSGRSARVAYVCDSAIADGGELELIETWVEAEELVQIDLADEERGLPDPLVLDLLLLMDSGPPEDARFEVGVWTPCESLPEEVGCHAGHPDYPGDPPADWRLQRVASGLKADLLGATYDENDQRSGMLRSPVLGCQCGAAGGNGILLLLALALAIRRFR